MKRSRHEKKMCWLAENEAQLEKSYAGMWVAVSDEGFAGAGATFIEAEARAREAGHHDVMVAPIKNREYQGITLIRDVRLSP